jgi:hypothetical protein
MFNKSILNRIRVQTSIGRAFARIRFREGRRFHRDQTGAVTVEAVLWMPFFLVLVFGIAELALVFHGQARALDVAQETNRGYSVGRFASTTDAADWAAFALSNFSNHIIVDTSLSDLIVTTVISIPAGDFAGNIGFLPFIQDFRIVVRDQQVVEF